MATLTQACCTLPPVQAKYESKGKVTKVGDMEVYEAKHDESKQTKNAIVVVYDIFGFHPNAFQTADILAERTGARVFIPDFFRGKPINFDDVVAKKVNVMGWIGEHGDWKKIKPDMHAVFSHINKHYGIEHVGTIGFCWGARMALNAAIEKDAFPGVVGVTMCHPSLVDADTLAKTDAPFCVLPSKDDPDFEPMIAPLKDRKWFSKIVHKRFPDMHHGWMAARGDWSNELQNKRATEGIEIAIEFFNSVF